MPFGTPRARFIVAVLLAAGIGFALGWYARQATQPSLEERIRDATTDLLKQLRRP